MRSIGYRAFSDDQSGGPYNACSRESSARPLMVNCAGNFAASYAFTTDNTEGRLDYYLLYVHSGNLKVYLPDKNEMLECGDFIIFPPKHHYKYSHESAEELDYFWVHFTGSEAESILAEYGLRMYPHVNHTKDDGGISMRFSGIFDAFAKQDALRDREISLLLEQLLISLSRRVHGTGSTGANQLRRSLAYINSAYNTEIRIPSLAAMENLSTSRYNALFKQLMGISPTEYIIKLRISTASELLVGTDLPVKEIARLVGYSDPHFFSRIFKANTQTPPAEYRKFK